MNSLGELALFVVLTAFFVTSCSDDKPASYSIEEPSPVSLPLIDLENIDSDGLVLVNSKGKKAVVGTSDVSAKTLERPQMGVNFGYDFYIGRHEVICKDYNAVMNTVTGASVACPQDSIPAANMTFYDVVLFANALSKQKGLDTAYVYSSFELNKEKHCERMNGFKFDPQANGFRLPTEAEWMLVASENWAPEKGWNGLNSESAPHVVCSSNESSGICDMAGNMLEFVNDRYSTFKDTVVSNFVGSVDGDALGSCVVKGGSYFGSPASMHLYNRGDTYPVLSSTKGEYLGFRLAKGPIPDALWFSDNGGAVSAPVKSIVEAAEMRSLTNSYNAKLAFRNDVSGNLVYVNFARNVKIVEIEDEIDVYHPDISPDGKRVAFCTVMEGSSKESSVYVRDLNETGSNLVKLPVERAAIPRWRVNPNGDTVIVYVSSAANNKGNQFMQESTWQVKFEKGAFGKPEKLFDGAYHSGVTKDNRFAVSASSLLRVRLSDGKKSSDKVWYNEEQACNASLAKDDSKRTLFLDFGGSQGRDFAGEKYGVHERMLIADSTGHLVKTISSPEGYTFDHTEWAVGILGKSPSYLAVATLTDYNGGHRQVSLVNINEDKIVPLVQGEELWHPCLWVWQDSPEHSKPLVDIDSAGAYYDKNAICPNAMCTIELGMRLQSFWQNCDKVEVATFGSSMMLNAVIEDSIKSYKTVNMAVTLMDIHLFDYLIKRYVVPYGTKIKYLVVELSPGLLFRKYSDMTASVLDWSPGISYDERHLSKETKAEIAALSLDQQFPQVLLGQQYVEGTFLLPSGEWGVPIINVDLFEMPFDSPDLQKNLAMLKSLKQLADSNGIQLIAAIPPRNPGYKDTEAFDPFGPTWEVAHQIIDVVKDMGIVIFDEYKDGHHDYPDAMAFNPNHVSYLGAAQFSARLDAFLKTLK